MAFKFFKQIIKEMDERGPIQVPNGYVTGEEFEKWLMEDFYCDFVKVSPAKTKVMVNDNKGVDNNGFYENYGEAA